VPDAKPDSIAPAPAKKKKKKQNAAALQRDLQNLAKPSGDAAEKPPVDFKKIFIRVGAVVAVIWVIAIALAHWSWIPLAVAGALTLVAAGGSVWVVRYVNKSRELGALLRSAADTKEGRDEALKKLESDYKKGDVQATLARAQLEMQDDPRKALATLESIDLSKQIDAVASQVRCMRATLHLQFGELPEARALVDKMELGKQQEPKTRAMFAAVAAETWGRTGQGKKAMELLDVFNPEDPDMSEMRLQMWRARAFAAAGVGDMKAAGRALRKLAEMNPQLLGMFVAAKKVHPMLQQEAKGILMRSGAVPRKMVRQKM
jgi:hypothetical protein